MMPSRRRNSLCRWLGKAKRVAKHDLWFFRFSLGFGTRGQVLRFHNSDWYFKAEILIDMHNMKVYDGKKRNLFETRAWLKFKRSDGSLRHVEKSYLCLCNSTKLLIRTGVLRILEIYVMVFLMACCIIRSSKGNPRYLITKCFNPHPHNR